MTDTFDYYKTHPDNRSGLWLPPTTRNKGRKGYGRAIELRNRCCNCGEPIGYGKAARMCSGCRLEQQHRTTYIEDFEVERDRIVFACPGCGGICRIIRDFKRPECHHVIDGGGRVVPSMNCPWIDKGCHWSGFIRLVENSKILIAEN